MRSIAGTFAWVTSHLLVATLARDARAAGLSIAAPKGPPDETWCQVTTDSVLRVPVQGKDKVVLEEFDLHADPGPADALATSLAPMLFPDDPEWQRLLRNRLCIVHDDVMSFLAQHATEIVTRVSIDPDTGTARKGQLWTEENLPSESVLVGLVEEVPNGRDREPGRHLHRLGELVAAPIQLGGKATVGRGRCQLRVAGEAR